MSYLVLARKYRPRTFGDVAGQELTTETLRGAIAENRIGHAYLFCGPRGTGKTTTARIFAKALNCERGPAADPCGQCERCLGAEEGSESDLIEIDAASHTGVDNVRDLRDQAAYAPMRARFKIYIVDEVHMLSKAAFNALLKTLEEPPPHVKFLFATTELHKVPDTIRSRCQILKLAPIAEAVIAARLGEVARLEGLSPAAGVLDEVARRAHGGLRDALSMLDQLLALGGDSPTLEDVSRLGGQRGPEQLDLLFARIEEHDPAGALAALSALEGDEDELLSALLDYLRTCLVVALCGAEAPFLAAPAPEVVRARAARLSHETLQTWMEELLHARERMRLVPGHERAILEVALLELCRPEASLALPELVERLLALEARLGGAAPAPVRARELEPAPRRERPAHSESAQRSETPVRSESAARSDLSAPSTAADPTPARRAAPQPTEAPRSAAPSTGASPSAGAIWDRALSELDRSHGAFAEALRMRGRLERVDAKEAVIALDGVQGSERKILEGRRNVAALARMLSIAAGREVSVSFVEHDAPPPVGQEPFTRKVADLFGGVIEEER